jgi:hypothetical protein
MTYIKYLLDAGKEHVFLILRRVSSVRKKARILCEPINIYFTVHIYIYIHIHTYIHTIRASLSSTVRLFYFQCRNAVLPYLTSPLSGALIRHSHVYKFGEGVGGEVK